MLIIFAVFCMSVQEGIFKKFSGEFSLWQIFTLRGILAIPLLLVITRFINLSQVFANAFKKWVIIRSTAMTLMFVAMYAAIPNLSLSTAAAGIYTAPIFVALLSAYGTNETVSVRGWFAIALGFAGVLVILKPGTDLFSYWSLLPVLGGFLYAVSNVITRVHCQSIPPVSLALSLNFLMLVVGSICSLVVASIVIDEVTSRQLAYLTWNWIDMTNSLWSVIIVLSLLVVLISVSLARAYQVAKPAIVATFDYSYLVFMAAWDYLFFERPPEATTILGIAMIIGAGIMAYRSSETANRR